MSYVLGNAAQQVKDPPGSEISDWNEGIVVLGSQEAPEKTYLFGNVAEHGRA